MKNIQKTNEICYCLGGGIQNLGGEISPPKGPEKNTAYQRRRRRSGWSGLGLTTFQRVVGLVLRLDRHPRVAKYTIMRIRRTAASDMAHSAACSSSASQPSPTRRPITETPHQPLSFLFLKQPFGKKDVVYIFFQPSWFASWTWFGKKNVVYILFSQVGFLLGRGCTTMIPHPPVHSARVIFYLTTFEMPVPPLHT